MFGSLNTTEHFAFITTKQYMETITLNNFKLNVFRSIMEQSLIVSKQLMFQIDPVMSKTCGFSPTKSLIKLVTIPTERLVDGAFTPFEKFDFSIFRGDVFKKYLSVYKDDTVDITFMVDAIGDKQKRQAIQIKIVNKTGLETIYATTTEGLMSDSVSDYNTLIDKVTPKPTMSEFIVQNADMADIRNLISTLHTADPKNIIYLCFEYNNETKQLTTKDSVFKQVVQHTLAKPATGNMLFNIMKSDYIRLGNHTHSIYVDQTSKEIILIAPYNGALISSLITKVDEGAASMDFGFSEHTNGLSSEELDEYFK